MKCFDCKNLDLRTYPKHSNTGYGRCKKETMPGVFESITIERECGKFEQAPPEEMIDRIDWWNQIVMFR